MEIREGVNTEYAARKFDVCLDDGDLAILLTEHGLSPETTFLNLSQKYMLLKNEARIIVLYELVGLGLMSPEQQTAELDQRTEQRKMWMDALRPAAPAAAAQAS